MTDDANAAPSSREEMQKIYHVLTNSFNDTELRALAFELNVRYDDLGGPETPFSTRAQALIEFFERRNRLNMLSLIVQDKRPDIDWNSIKVTVIDVDLEPVTPKRKLPEASKSATMIAAEGFRALMRMMKSPEVLTAVVSFKENFQSASIQIDAMVDIKFLHDLFQELENRYVLIYNDQRRLPEDDAAWDSIELNELELRSKITDILEAVNRPTFGEEDTRWTAQLGKVNDTMQTAVEEFDDKKLSSATRWLTSILNKQPSRLNTQLVTSARTLRLEKLEGAMQTISTSLTGGDFDTELLRQTQEGIDALAGLDDRLDNLVSEHDSWQSIDDDLRMIDSSLDQGPEELEFAWVDIEPRVGDICKAYRDQDWATAIVKVSAALGKAIEEQDEVVMKRQFRRFRSQVSRRFRNVDDELLALSRNLQKVGESLDLLLRDFK